MHGQVILTMSTRVQNIEEGVLGQKVGELIQTQSGIVSAATWSSLTAGLSGSMLLATPFCSAPQPFQVGSCFNNLYLKP